MSHHEFDDTPMHPDAWNREMIRQLERMEKITPEQMYDYQRSCLLELVEHAIETVPGYKARLKPLIRPNGEISLDGWHDVPVLSREEAVALGDELVSLDVPDRHGQVKSGATSGSTGQPFKFKATQYHYTMVQCISARYHRWHKFDYRKKLASIYPYKLGVASWPQGKQSNSWASHALKPGDPGEYYRLNLNTVVDRQCEWLRRIRPAYIHSFPSNIRALALAFEEQGEPLNLQGVLSFAEMMTPDTREIISQVFGCQVGDCYSSEECGYIALQSPASENWLVQSEVMYLEILNDQHHPCQPGELGHVVATPLLNYAQPLIRYDLGDLAAWGENDVADLPYPVLSHINGRIRNMFRFPGGRTIQPCFKTVSLQHYLKPKQWQVAQVGETTLEIRIVPGIEPARMDTQGMTEYIEDLLEMDLTINYKLVDSLTNPRTGKCEDYICELEDV